MGIESEGTLGLEHGTESVQGAPVPRVTSMPLPFLFYLVFVQC